jgi:predicted flap endonuclease-1-like 5' DNA nuclease
MCIPCFLIPIIVGLICALLGYLLGKLLSKKSGSSSDFKADLDACLKNANKYHAENATLRAEISNLKASLITNKQGFVSEVSSPTIPFDAALAAGVYGKKIKQDDLKIVEGIGPKIEELYINAGISTWKALSETPLETSKKILSDAGERFALHNPGTWAKQAQLAYEGKWETLKEWQDQLDGGKE